MAKSDLDHASQLLGMAEKDHLALSNMLDAEIFSEEVFGFHAQQTLEKSLKAWIALLHLQYPKSHDVSALVGMLRRAGANHQSLDGLEDYTVFAVQYRYEAYDERDERLDRTATLDKTRALVSHVRGLVEASR